jgi:hypothetical protein
MQLRKFFVPATDVGVGRTFRHFAAMLLTLTLIGHLIKRHGHYFYMRQLYKLSAAPRSRIVAAMMEPLHSSGCVPNSVGKVRPFSLTL